MFTNQTTKTQMQQELLTQIMTEQVPGSSEGLIDKLLQERFGVICIWKIVFSCCNLLHLYETTKSRTLLAGEKKAM